MSTCSATLSYRGSRSAASSCLPRSSGAHWLGTDAVGRDVFSRVIAGAQTAFFGPLVIAVASFILGNLLGLFAGYRGGLADAVLMRWVDFMWSLPALVILVVVAGTVGNSYWLAVGVV